MTGIQIILISGVLLSFFLYFLKWRNNIIDLLIFTLLVGTAIIFILFPHWTSIIAHKLGVGRGADLVFYLCILLFSFVLLKLYTRVRRLEQQITEAVRKNSIDEASNEKE